MLINLTYIRVLICQFQNEFQSIQWEPIKNEICSMEKDIINTINQWFSTAETSSGARTWIFFETSDYTEFNSY